MDERNFGNDAIIWIKHWTKKEVREIIFNFNILKRFWVSRDNATWFNKEKELHYTYATPMIISTTFLTLLVFKDMINTKQKEATGSIIKMLLTIFPQSKDAKINIFDYFKSFQDDKLLEAINLFDSKEIRDTEAFKIINNDIRNNQLVRLLLPVLNQYL